jgi:hypothetical protein
MVQINQMAKVLVKNLRTRKMIKISIIIAKLKKQKKVKNKKNKYSHKLNKFKSNLKI